MLNLHYQLPCLNHIEPSICCKQVARLPKATARVLPSSPSCQLQGMLCVNLYGAPAERSLHSARECHPMSYKQAKEGNSMAQLENSTSQRTQWMGSGWSPWQSVYLNSDCCFTKRSFWPLPSGNLQTGPISHCRMNPPRRSQLASSHHANTRQKHYALGSTQALHVYPYAVIIDPVDCCFHTFGCSYSDSACFA